MAATQVIGGVMQADAASEAAGIQGDAAQAGIAEQRAAREQMAKLLEPYRQAGLPALQQQQAMLGLNGADAERAALAGISGSPTMQAMMQQGENALLQNASATGGLRGGNIQAALAQFRPQMLAQEIENRYARLAGMTSLGQNAAAGVGNAGMQTGTNIANLLGQQGAAAAGGALAQGQMFGNIGAGINQGLGMYAGMGGKFPWQNASQGQPIPWELGF
jgi:hypothetical protein